VNKRLLITLADIWSYQRDGYPSCWEPKSRAKLQEMSLVRSEPGKFSWDPEGFYLTEAGAQLLHREKEKSG